MICRKCADAADKGLPHDAHCDTAGCSCGHRPPVKHKETAC